MHALASKLTHTTATLQYHKTHDARNREAGASGFKHQIDVTIKAPDFLLLIECKHLARPIGASTVLVLASRFADIKAANLSTNVYASVVSMQVPTKGAVRLASSFGVDLHVVASIEDYALRIGFQYFFGVRDDARGSETISIEKRGSKCD